MFPLCLGFSWPVTSSFPCGVWRSSEPIWSIQECHLRRNTEDDWREQVSHLGGWRVWVVVLGHTLTVVRHEGDLGCQSVRTSVSSAFGHEWASVCCSVWAPRPIAPRLWVAFKGQHWPLSAGIVWLGRGWWGLVGWGWELELTCIPPTVLHQVQGLAWE